MQNVGMIILRVVLGFIFAIHGLQKFQAGLGNIAGFFDSIGIPGFLAYVVAIIELVGGILLILGVGTRVMSALIALVMVGAIFTAKFSVGFIAADGSTGYEYDVALAAIAIYFIFAGAGQYSVDQFIANKKLAKN